MKKLIIYIMLILFCSSTLLSQTIVEQYDSLHTDVVVSGDRRFTRCNNIETSTTGHLLKWNGDYLLQSEMQIYHALKDYDYSKAITYLKEAIKGFDDVIQYRDDNKGNNLEEATWSELMPYYVDTVVPEGEEYAWVVHSGMVTYPMADFVQEVINDAGNLGYETMPSTYSDCQYYHDKSFSVIANELRDRIIETIDAHDYEWHNIDSNYGTYRFYDGDPIYINYHNKHLPWNMNFAMGRTLLMMYYACHDDTDYIPNSDSTYDDMADIYLDKVQRMANYFMSEIDIEDGDKYVWNYAPDYNNDGSVENTAHAFIDIDFMLLCYEHYSDVGVSIDMTKFAKGFYHLIYEEPLAINNYVDGSSETLPSSLFPGLYVGLKDFIYDEIYQIGADNCAELATSVSSLGSCWHLLSLANLQRYKNFMEPMFVSRGPGSGSDWSGVDCGDIDGDGISNDYAAVRNGDGTMYVNRISVNGGDVQDNNVVAKTFPTNTVWGDIAVGDFDGDGVDEIIAANNLNGDLYVYELSCPTCTTLTEIDISLQGDGSDWSGLAAGDFNGDGKDEIVAVRNGDGGIYVYELDGSNNLASIDYTILSQTWGGVSAGDLDGDGKDEFVALNNTNGDLYMYRLNSSDEITSVTVKDNGEDSDWTDIAAGDFDGDGLAEFIARRAYDGDMYFYQFNGTSLEGISSDSREYFPADQEIATLGSGLREDANATQDRLISFRNFDGNFFIWDIDIEDASSAITCTDLDMDDITTSNTKDYYANDNITASDFTIEDGADIIFRAGTNVVLETGFIVEAGAEFIAYIDDELDCTDTQGQKSAGKKQPKHYRENVILEDDDKLKDGNYLKATIYPNPNTGRFTVELEGVKESASISVSNMLGCEILSKTLTTNTCEIDLRNEPKGIYIVKTIVGRETFVEKVIYK
ncbi:MAG: T9SS type A sorting domain-containing protein [Nanoarchaeota archaeon]